MKFIVIHVLALSLVFGTTARAWKEVGNSGQGAGISEQNIIFAQLNVEEVFRAHANLQRFAQRLHQVNLKFDISTTTSKAFATAKNEWTLYPRNFARFDLDQSEVLNLREAYLFLFAIYRSENEVNNVDAEALAAEISATLIHQENSQILEFNKLQLQWLQIQDDGMNSLMLSMVDKQALLIRPEVMGATLCAGVLESLEFYNPHFIRNDQDADGMTLLLGARAISVCDGVRSDIKVFIQLRADKASEALSLLDFGAY